MIKINKSFTINNTPDSLRPAFEEFFLPRNIQRASKTTTKRRRELIINGAYIDDDIYNSRYKVSDIQTSLSQIYHSKCAFCEQRVEQFHVEHYRPKQIYHWLAYSWNNLLFACQFCNEYKGTNFSINGQVAVYANDDVTFKAINVISYQYDATELPNLVNPEITNPDINIYFDRHGKIFSDDPRFIYTITTCRIDRTYLNDLRLKILQDLRADLTSLLVEFNSVEEQTIAIRTIVMKFNSDANNNNNEFIAFRKFVITNWMSQEINELIL